MQEHHIQVCRRNLDNFIGKVFKKYYTSRIVFIKLHKVEHFVLYGQQQKQQTNPLNICVAFERRTKIQKESLLALMIKALYAKSFFF
jgi:hypothetical protein